MKGSLDTLLRLPSRISPPVGPTGTLELQALVSTLEMLAFLVWMPQLESRRSRTVAPSLGGFVPQWTQNYVSRNM